MYGFLCPRDKINEWPFREVVGLDCIYSSFHWLFGLYLGECPTNSHTCDVNAVCQNTTGSHTCLCKLGYTGDGTTCYGKAILVAQVVLN